MGKSLRFGVGIAVLALCAGACGGGGGASSGGAKEPAKAAAPADPTGGSHALPDMPGVVSCYAGTIQVAGGTSGYYIRQGWDNDQKLLTQDTVLYSQGKGTRTWTTIKASDETTLAVDGKYQGGTFAGSGKVLTNGVSDREWLAWMTEITLDAGAKVKGQVASTGDAVAGRSEVVGGATFVFDTKKIDDARCKTIFSSFAPL